MIDLNALLGRRVEYYEYPWAIEARFGDARARFRSWFQAPDVGFVLPWFGPPIFRRARED